RQRSDPPAGGSAARGAGCRTRAAGRPSRRGPSPPSGSTPPGRPCRPPLESTVPPAPGRRRGGRESTPIEPTLVVLLRSLFKRAPKKRGRPRLTLAVVSAVERPAAGGPAHASDLSSLVPRRVY